MNKFEVGTIIYRVYAFPAEPESNFVMEYTVLGYGTFDTLHDVACMRVRGKNAMSTTEISLRDANIIPNTYNCHRVFETKFEVDKYLADPSLWRPLAISEEDWISFAKADYIEAREWDLEFMSWDLE